MKFYAIRHKPTGTILNINWTKGASYWDPISIEIDAIPPRLFTTLRAAQNFINSWLRGTVKQHYDDENGGSYLEITPVPTRKRDDLEIIPVELALMSPITR